MPVKDSTHPATHERHGHTDSKGWQSREYRAWACMKTRCTNPRNKAYRNYGARGITVCDRWLHSFESFLADMGACPSESHELDRIDNAGNYEPGNCRWATRKQQARNKRNNHLYEHAGESLTVGEWAERLGMKPHTIKDRLRLGWTITDALTLPISQHPRGPRRFRAKACSSHSPPAR